MTTRTAARASLFILVGALLVGGLLGGVIERRRGPEAGADAIEQVGTVACFMVMAVWCLWLVNRPWDKVPDKPPAETQPHAEQGSGNPAASA